MHSDKQDKNKDQLSDKEKQNQDPNYESPVKNIIVFAILMGIMIIMKVFNLF
ncbi:MAG: hypothetical protein GX221_04855 [Candidatus Riflebacteria bacterium]|nr:hypothetical protein [Candidatus Riflebacteria bacterium]